MTAHAGESSERKIASVARPLYVLYLEDNLRDCLLVQEMLAAEGLACEMLQVESEKGFLEHLDRPLLDLILSDFSLPGYDGLSALAGARQRRPEVPFIFVTGTLGEDRAIEALTHGAKDYVLKQRMSRLAPAVRRALREVEAARALRQTEEQLRQAQKMEILGQLAGGIAHDFNSLLTVIQGYTELLLDHPGSEADLQSGLEQIKGAAERAALITRQLLAFSRKQSLTAERLDMNAVINGCAKMLRMLVGPRVEFSIVPSPEPALVSVDPNQIQQVLLNLASNARDAMPDGGRVWIEIGNVEIDRTVPGDHTGSERWVIVSVHDTGTGMDPETVDRIFEPFFTTKEAERGTGLGLPTVRGIVTQHGGHIVVKSEPGRGSTFQVHLPRVEYN